MTDIRNAYSRRETPTLLSSTYSLPLDPVAEYKIKYNARAPTGENLVSLTVLTVTQIFTKWFHYPQNQSRLQGTFIRQLLHHVNNTDVLLIPGVYKAFTQVRHTLMGSSTTRASRLPTTAVEPFVNHLKTQSICNPDSQAFKTLGQISLRVEHLREQWRGVVGGNRIVNGK